MPTICLSYYRKAHLLGTPQDPLRSLCGLLLRVHGREAAQNLPLIADSHCGHAKHSQICHFGLPHLCCNLISLSEIHKCNPCLTSIPLAMTCDLLAGQKQRLWRVSSACRRCGAKSASSSRAPVSLRMLCWPSSVNETLASSLSHRPRRLQPVLTEAAFTPAALGTGTDKKA